MRVYNVTDLDGVHSMTPIKGSLALREIYLWPAWNKPNSSVLFSYQKKHQPGRVYTVPIEYGKTYMFEDIQKLINDHFNITEIIVILYHNNSRVTLNLKKDKGFYNLKLCDELVSIMRLPKLETYEGLTPGDEVDVNSIKLVFNDTDLLYLKCSELDESNVFENSISSSLMTIVPLEYSTHNNKLIKFRDVKPLFHPLTQRETIYDLHFTIEDSEGNKLPYHKCVFTVLNK